MFFKDPENGGCYVLGEEDRKTGLSIHLFLGVTVNEPANIFMERQRSSKICYDASWKTLQASGEKVEEAIIISSDIQEPKQVKLISEDSKTRIGCVTFTEEGSKLSSLGLGTYELEGSLVELMESERKMVKGIKGGTMRVKFVVVGRKEDCPLAVRQCAKFEITRYEDGNAFEEILTWCKEDDESLYDFARRYCQRMLPHITCVDKVLKRASEQLNEDLT